MPISIPVVIRLLTAARNEGKGAALRRAIAVAHGEFCIIQDADHLEYNPSEYLKLLGPLVDGRADAVYGSRFMSSGERRVLYFWHSLANHLLTGMCNIFADLNLTDMETCYKAFRTSLLQSIPLRNPRFGFEPETNNDQTGEAPGCASMKHPSATAERTYDEGKKIGLKDAFEAFWVIFKTALTNDIYVAKDKDILDAFASAPNFNRWMADTIQPYIGKRVLEIGAGMGNLTRLLLAGRKRYVATDIDREHLERLRNRLSQRPNLETVELNAADPQCVEDFRGQMDTVVCLNVLEHIEDAPGCLAQHPVPCCRMAAPR